MRRLAPLVGALVVLSACSDVVETAPTTAPPTTSTTSSTSSTTSTTSSTTTTVAPATTAPPSTTSTIDLAVSNPADVALTDALVDRSIGRGDRAISVAVVRNGQLEHTAVVGDGLTPTSGFRLASVSKFLVAATALQLAHDGTLQLDAPFASQLGITTPLRDVRIAGITVRQLLSHTSGFRADKALFFSTTSGDWRQAGLFGLDSALQFSPGTGYQYSNMNYVLLGLLIEHLTDVSIDEAIERYVGDAVGAGSIRLAGTVDSRPGEATYASAPGRHYMEMLGPAGGMVAPAAYVALAAARVADGSGLTSPVDVLAMRTPQTPFRANRNFDYGLGTMLFDGGWWGHSGTIENTRGLVVTSPEGVTVAVLVSGDAFGTGEDILDVVQRYVQ